MTDFFYNKLFRKAVIIFGSQFNGLYVGRYNANGTLHQKIPVPIAYSPIDKYLARIQGDRAGNREISIVLPRMGFKISSFGRDSSRTVTKTNRVRTGTKNSYVAVPYRIDFEMYIMAKSIEDGLQILEQIIPYFNPHINVKADLMDGLTQDDISINLNNTSWQDTYDSDFTTRRLFIITLDFTMNFLFYGPERDSKLIKFAQVSVNSNIDMTGELAEVTIQPGLTVDGEPTTDITETIDYHFINPDDDYGIIETITES
jgi:hypothetical protein